jgi:hypothetical protein
MKRLVVILLSLASGLYAHSQADGKSVVGVAEFTSEVKSKTRNYTKEGEVRPPYH